MSFWYQIWCIFLLWSHFDQDSNELCVKIMHLSINDNPGTWNFIMTTDPVMDDLCWLSHIHLEKERQRQIKLCSLPEPSLLTFENPKLNLGLITVIVFVSHRSIGFLLDSLIAGSFFRLRDLWSFAVWNELYSFYLIEHNVEVNSDSWTS